jgi:hypothetical protein
MDLEKLHEEEKELDKLVYGEEETPTPPQEEPEVKVEEQPEVDQKPKKPRPSWKKRYTNYKATTDNTIFELRKELAAWKSQVASKDSLVEDLQKELSKLKQKLTEKTDPFEGVITKEDEDLIGPEAVEIIKKAVKSRPNNDDSKYQKLQEEIDNLKREKREQLKRESEAVEKDSLVNLKKKLTTIVPDWESIDLEDGFKDFINDADPASGLPRSKFFLSAISTFDVERVASFYNAYKALKPKSKEEILESKVTPAGGGSEENDQKVDESKKVYSIQDYNRFMDDLAKGKYNSTAQLRKEAAVLERKFDLAIMEGRMR